MQIFCQRDPRWSGRTIPNSQLTMARAGCTVSCVAMLTSYFLPEYTPGQLLDKLRFAPGGLIIWESCRFENFAWYRRTYSPALAEIVQHIREPSLAVILQVSGGTHWVVATSYNRILNKIGIADPWLGDRSTMDRYHGDITGAAYFGRSNLAARRS